MPQRIYSLITDDDSVPQRIYSLITDDESVPQRNSKSCVPTIPLTYPVIVFLRLNVINMPQRKVEKLLWGTR